MKCKKCRKCLTWLISTSNFLTYKNASQKYVHLAGTLWENYLKLFGYRQNRHVHNDYGNSRLLCVCWNGWPYNVYRHTKCLSRRGKLWSVCYNFVIPQIKFCANLQWSVSINFLSTFEYFGYNITASRVVYYLHHKPRSTQHSASEWHWSFINFSISFQNVLISSREKSELRDVRGRYTCPECEK